MINQVNALRETTDQILYGKGDLLVIIGEIFNRGYVNGIVDAAVKREMTVVYSTVGRRQTDGTLQSLNQEELATSSKSLINVPLEAGFDMEPSENGISPVDQLRSIKLSSWKEATLDWEALSESKTKGQARFKKNLQIFVKELSPYVSKASNVLFIHTMAGGIPRSKIYMPILNRVFKGTGKRFEPSKTFWTSELGRLCHDSFSEVSAQTFKHLIDGTQSVRDKISNQGGSVHYAAYGYHGTEILIDDCYQWQSYTPYLQGWAKIELESIALKAWDQGVRATVFNCPEILTNSSSVFQGVELSLYPLLGALRREAPNVPHIEKLIQRCQECLLPGIILDQLNTQLMKYLKSELKTKWTDLESWPQHNGQEQLKEQLDASSELVQMQSDKSNPLTQLLSEIVFRSTGPIILGEMWQPSAPVIWLGHDIVARKAATLS